MTSSAAAKAYFASTDYYASCPGDWLGKGAEMLGLVGSHNPEHFYSLADNLDPRTGKQLTAANKDGRRVGMDLTFNSTKSVGIARELAGSENGGDNLIELAHREAVAYAMGHIEADMHTRVRVGGADHDRRTGNLVAYRVTHRDTRISAEDQRPDMSLHCHVFVFNATFDPVEKRWKAAQMGDIKHDAPYFESIFHNRLASNLRTLGYGIRRDGKAFEIQGIDRPLIEKFSRRSEYIKAVAAKLGITRPETKAKLGATTRMGKAKEMADDLNAYYVTRLTDAEKQQLTNLIGQPSYISSEEKAVAFAIGHTFERQSVAEERKLYETAIRHGIGSVMPEEVIEETKRQGALLKDGQVTTKAVLAEESRIIDFAREGKGTMPPMGRPGAVVTPGAVEGQRATSTVFSQQKGRPDESKRPVQTDYQSIYATNTATLHPEQQAVSTDHVPGARKMAGLSPEQTALVNHVLTSTDQLILCIGDAGTGKTRSIKTAFEQIDRPIEMLAPSAEASRGVLRGEGFTNADTVASFLLSEDRQSAIRNGVIWVDEAGLLPIKDLSRLTDIAKQQHARIVLQGDPKQHHSPARNGNMMSVLQEYAGLPVGRLTEVWRQKHTGYKALVADIARGDRGKAFDALANLGWVQRVDGNTPLVDEYISGLRAGKDMLVVAPTHAEGDEVTAAIRARLKDDGKLDEDHTVQQLVPFNWTEAERGDRERYDGTEVLQFHRNSGTFKAGDRIRMSDFKPTDRYKSPAHFSVYREDTIPVAAGDKLRITANGKSLDGHKLNNGAVYRVKGFDQHDNLVLDNGWTVGKEFKHLTHGYVSTSHASQGKTVDRVLIAMGSESKPAINAEQFYVSVSRGKESAKVFTDMPPEELKHAIQRTDPRKSATELMRPKPKKKRRLLDGMRHLLRKARDRLKLLQSPQISDTREPSRMREQHAGLER